MSNSFSAWKMGAPYYVPPILLGLGSLPFTSGTSLGYVSATVLAIGAFVLFFFRDPPRRLPTDPDAILSPADGTVVAIEELTESPHYPGPCTRVSIFLSVFNVHVNRAPFDCEVRDLRYSKGRYMNAMKAESSRVNESNAIWLDTPQGPMTVRQISGAIARRIVCIPRIGDKLAKGQKIGMIKFGSRTELYLPPGVSIETSLKSRVRAGTTVIARIP